MFSEIQEKIKTAPALDFGDIFNKSVELFKKSWLYGFLLQLIILIIMLPFIIIIYVPFVMAILNQSENGHVDPHIFSSFFSGLTVVYIVFFIIGIIAVASISVALNAGFFRLLKNIDLGREVKVSDLFYFLNGRHFGSVTMLMFATIVISLIAAILCYVPLIYAIIPISFFTIVYAFNPDMSIGNIVKISFSLGTKKWLISFGLFIVTYLVVILLTILTCGIGSLFLSPFVYLPLYFVYKQVIGFETPNVFE
jgi:hypothetical protein